MGKKREKILIEGHELYVPGTKVWFDRGTGICLEDGWRKASD